MNSVAKKRIPDDPGGFAELIEMLTAAGDCADHPVPVAIETPRGLSAALYLEVLMSSEDRSLADGDLAA